MANLIYQLSQKSIHNEKLALARSALALCGLLTLMFNDISLLTNQEYLSMGKSVSRFNSIFFGANISLFNIFSDVAAKSIAIIILVSVISGYLPQITCILHCWVSLSITNSVIPLDGGDQIASNLTLLLIPICLADKRFNQWHKLKETDRPLTNIFCNVNLAFIQLQAAIIYLHSGMGKIYTEEWKDGTAAYYWLSHPVNGAPDWLKSIYETVTLSNGVFLISWAIIVLEMFLFACIFAGKKTKTLFFLLAFLFHFFIILTHGLLSFFFAMLGLILLYLDDANNSIKVIELIKRKIQNARERLSGKTRFAS